MTQHNEPARFEPGQLNPMVQWTNYLAIAPLMRSDIDKHNKITGKKYRFFLNCKIVRENAQIFSKMQQCDMNLWATKWYLIFSWIQDYGNLDFISVYLIAVYKAFSKIKHKISVPKWLP